MHPNGIKIKAIGPNNIPCNAPIIGPMPAMFRKCISEFLFFDIGTKSTPSFKDVAGVSVSFGSNCCSMYFEYRIPPMINIRIPKRNVAMVNFAYSIVFLSSSLDLMLKYLGATSNTVLQPI